MLRELRDVGTQRGAVDRMQTRAELYDLIGYMDWEERDRAYFARGGASSGTGSEGVPSGPSD
jgi:methylisocitrate lyase